MVKKLLLITNILLLIYGCKDLYEPNIESPHTGYLIVEGFINYGNSPTVITLSRTVKLIDSVAYKPETNALVYVEEENGAKTNLTQTVQGVYSGLPHLTETKKYRLVINTSEGKEYVSEYSTVKKTPDIENISWKRENNGVRVYVHTHDINKNTKYYRWSFDETWEIHSSFEKLLEYIYDARGNIIGVKYINENREREPGIYTCWKNDKSSNILIGSSEKLVEDRIYLPVAFIEQTSEKLSVKYSINLKQYTISASAYNFYLQMKKNTEQLGSIFDPQPTELKGNIVCTTDPNEVVVGYVEISEEKIKRIFIDRMEVADWRYSAPCMESVIPNHPDSIHMYAFGLLPTKVVEEGEKGSIIKFAASDRYCVDCRVRGTNVRPDFWPR